MSETSNPIFPVACTHCKQELLVPNDGTYTCKGCGNQFQANPIKNSAKVCTNCGKWVQKNVNACPACSATTFSEDLEYKVKQANRNTTGAVIALIVTIILGIIFAVSTFGVLGVPAAFIAYKLIKSISGVTAEINAARVLTNQERNAFEHELRKSLKEKLVHHGKKLKQLETEALNLALLNNPEETAQEEELEALNLKSFNKTKEAAQKGEEAVRAGTKNVDVKLCYAANLVRLGKADKAIETLLSIEGPLGDIQRRMMLSLYRKIGTMPFTAVQRLATWEDPSILDERTYVVIAKSLMDNGELMAASAILQSLSGSRRLRIEEANQSALGLLITSILGGNGEMVIKETVDWWQKNRGDSNATRIIAHLLKRCQAPVEDVRSVYEEYVKQVPDDFDIIEQLVGLYIQEKKPEDVESLLATVGNAVYEQPAIAYKLGLMNLKQGNVDRAVTILQKIEKADGIPYDQLQIVLGNAYRQKGLWELALSTYRKVEEDERRIDVMYKLGVSAQEKGKNDIAGKCYEYIYGINAGYMDVSQRLAQL